MRPGADARVVSGDDSGSTTTDREEHPVNPTESTWSGPNRLRTSDTEREQVAEIVRAAMAEGRLTLEEGEERLGAVYAAKYRDELAPLTADLPGNGRPAVADTPGARLATRRSMRRHVGFVASLGLILTGLWVLSGAHFFWPAIPLAFLVMGLVRHARWRNYEHHYNYAHRVAPWNAPGYR
jgi:hypothetical protein